MSGNANLIIFGQLLGPKIWLLNSNPLIRVNIFVKKINHSTQKYCILDCKKNNKSKNLEFYFYSFPNKKMGI